jgi:16S rRNA (cytidine1402-2'-O)-methyltransferase
MMASGMNGQSFTFHGYLPIEKGRKSSPKKSRENFAGKKSVSNFIETPYRNNKMLKISYRLYILKPIVYCY